MALKHLKDAVELLRAGMSISDINRIVGLSDPEPADAAPEGQEEAQPEDGSGTGPAEEPAPEETPAPEKKTEVSPYRQPAVNLQGDQLLDDLNKIL